MNGTDRAIELAGSQSQLARDVGVTPQAVSKWQAAGQVGPEHVQIVSQLYGIPVSELNPLFEGMIRKNLSPPNEAA